MLGGSCAFGRVAGCWWCGRSLSAASSALRRQSQCLSRQLRWKARRTRSRGHTRLPWRPSRSRMTEFEPSRRAVRRALREWEIIIGAALAVTILFGRGDGRAFFICFFLGLGLLAWAYLFALRRKARLIVQDRTLGIRHTFFLTQTVKRDQVHSITLAYPYVIFRDVEDGRLLSLYIPLWFGPPLDGFIAAAEIEDVRRDGRKRRRLRVVGRDVNPEQ